MLPWSVQAPLEQILGVEVKKEITKLSTVPAVLWRSKIAVNHLCFVNVQFAGLGSPPNGVDVVKT